MPPYNNSCHFQKWIRAFNRNVIYIKQCKYSKALQVLHKSYTPILPYIYSRGPWALTSENSEDATKGPRVYKYRISRWTRRIMARPGGPVLAGPVLRRISQLRMRRTLNYKSALCVPPHYPCSHAFLHSACDLGDRACILPGTLELTNHVKI